MGARALLAYLGLDGGLQYVRSSKEEVDVGRKGREGCGVVWSSSGVWIFLFFLRDVVINQGMWLLGFEAAKALRLPFVFFG